MPIIQQLPSASVIQQHKGTLDYYKWRGLSVVRGWPRRPTMPRSPASTNTAQRFGTLAREINSSPALIRDAATSWANGTTWTWRDVVTRSAYGHLYKW